MSSDTGWDMVVRTVARAKVSRVLVLAENDSGVGQDACLAAYIKLAAQAAEQNPDLKTVLLCGGGSVMTYRNLIRTSLGSKVDPKLIVSPSAKHLTSADLLFLAPDGADSLFEHQPGQIRVAFSRGKLEALEGSTDHLPFDILHMTGHVALKAFDRIVVARHAYWLQADRKHHFSVVKAFRQTVRSGVVGMIEEDAVESPLLHDGSARDYLGSEGFVLIADAPFHPSGHVLVTPAPEAKLPRGCRKLYVLTEWDDEPVYQTVLGTTLDLRLHAWLESLSSTLAAEGGPWRVILNMITIDLTEDPEQIAIDIEDCAPEGGFEDIVFESDGGEG